MKQELIAGFIIIIIIVLISGCGGGGDGSGSGGGYDTPERKEARNKIDYVKGLIDDCEIVIETAENVGVKSSLINPAREDLINAKKRIDDADNEYKSDNYNSAKLDAESAESYVISAKEYAKKQIKQLKDEVRMMLKETDSNIISSENYIQSKSDVGNSTITAMEMINFAKDEIESAWTKYDEEKYGVALEKSKQASSYSFEAKNMVELVVGKLTKKTIEIATVDVDDSIQRVYEVEGAGVSITSAKSKLSDAADHLETAVNYFNQKEYEKAQASAVKASRLSIESKNDADIKLDNFVESNLVKLGGDIRDVKEKIEVAQSVGITTYKEENQVEDVENLFSDATSSKLSGGPKELLNSARYITDGNKYLRDINQSLDMKKERFELMTMTFFVGLTCILMIISIIRHKGK